jgi:hypothetical protein
MRSNVAEVERHLIPLIGLPLSLFHRVADLNVFQFGDLREIDGRSVGRYTIHIQCPWRLEHDGRIVTGRADLWEPLDPAAVVNWDAWNYDRDANLQDTLLASFIAHHDQDTQPQSAQVHQRIVEAVQADAYGGASITFNDKYRLVIFPAGSRGEDWRLFQPEAGGEHFVIVGGMIV